MVPKGIDATGIVKINDGLEQVATIPLTKTRCGCASDADHTTPTDVTLAAGEPKKTFVFSTVQDSNSELSELLRIGLGTGSPSQGLAVRSGGLGQQKGPHTWTNQRGPPGRLPAAPHQP